MKLLWDVFVSKITWKVWYNHHNYHVNNSTETFFNCISSHLNVFILGDDLEKTVMYVTNSWSAIGGFFVVNALKKILYVFCAVLTAARCGAWSRQRDLQMGNTVVSWGSWLTHTEMLTGYWIWTLCSTTTKTVIWAFVPKDFFKDLCILSI